MKIFSLIMLGFLISGCAENRKISMIDSTVDDVKLCYSRLADGIRLALNENELFLTKEIEVVAILNAHGGDIEVLVGGVEPHFYLVRGNEIVSSSVVDKENVRIPIIDLQYLNGSVGGTIADENCYAVSSPNGISYLSARHFDYMLKMHVDQISDALRIISKQMYEDNKKQQ